MSEKNIVYRERQRFSQFWLWVVVLGVASIFWVGFVSQVLCGGALGSHPASVPGLTLLFVLLGLGLDRKSVV